MRSEMSANELLRCAFPSSIAGVSDGDLCVIPASSGCGNLQLERRRG